jgi:glycosyltransferase involved in cell wall biosynthesis
LAEGLSQLLEDHALRDHAGHAGEMAVREQFTAGAMAREVAAILQQNQSLAKLPS